MKQTKRRILTVSICEILEQSVARSDIWEFMKSVAASIPLHLWFENVLKKYRIQPIRKLSAIRLAKMKRVLAVKTPIGGVVQIVPCEQNGATVALSWRETVLTDAEKEASRLYLFDEGFIERAAGTLEPDIEIERFLKGIPDTN